MYRLLIVDDEPVIVNGLVQLFQENTELELDVCKAYSAKEALEMARKMKLDILISDIRMPYKSGLQLVDEIAYYWPLCRVIFLTGYSEFDYVHEALRKNVDNYILKTEGIEPIFEAVKKASAKLDEENRRRIRDEKAELHFQIAESVLRNELMQRALGGELICELLTDARYEELSLGIDAERPAFFVMANIDRMKEKPDKGTREAIRRIFDNDLPSTFTSEYVVLEDGAQIWLLQPGSELLGRFQEAEGKLRIHWHGITVYIKGILELVQNECEQLLDLSVSFGISGNLEGRWETAGSQYETLRRMMQGRAAMGHHMVIVDIEKASIHEEALYEPGRMKQEDMKQLVIDQIHGYIDTHLSGDVSLTAIAEEVHFNPSYLSRYYKQMTGQNLLDYIQNKKLEEAVQLMSYTTLKLNEIAARVGFDSHSYFTTFFKKKMGKSPQDYRNANLAGGK